MKINLRKTNSDDLKFLDKIRGEKLPKLHNSRLKEQEQGESLYLIAFLGETPVGHVYIKLQGSERYHSSPTLQDLYVAEELRGQKIGTQIIKQAEKYLKKLGYEKISLDVEISEEWIKKFYEKMGFKIKSGPHKQSWIEQDSGEQVEIDVFYLEKKIK